MIDSTTARNVLIDKLKDEVSKRNNPTQKQDKPAPKLLDEKKEHKKAKGQVSYKEIIGSDHPSGNKYYFTSYKKEDWEPELQSLIPAIDETHQFDHDYALSILMAIEFDKVCFAFGPPGSGKSITPEQICARINYPFMFISGMGGTEPSDFVGSPWVKEGSMDWRDGPASYAVRKGVFLLYDEPFKSSAQTNMCFQSLMDTRKTLKLYGHPNPIEGHLKAHEKFRICLADNVRGFGDEMDKYSAEIQDQSTLNRCAYKVHVDYVPASVEKELLKAKYPEVKEELVGRVVSFAGLLRTAWKKGDIVAPFSIRDTQEWVEASLFMQDIAAAFKQTYFNSVKDDSEAKAIRDCWKTAFGSSVSL